MIHRLYVITVVCLLTLWAHAYGHTPAQQGMVVDIADCRISWRIWTDALSIRCDYRVNEGEWRHVASGEAPENPDLFIPGTSVHLAVIDHWFYAQFDEDVRELRWID